MVTSSGTEAERRGHGPDEMYIAADFTGDGRNDLLTRFPLNGQGLKLYRNTGSGFAVSDAIPGLGLDYTVFENGDFDGDGQTDLLIGRGVFDGLGFLRTGTRGVVDAQVCYSRHRQGQGFQCQAWVEANAAESNLHLVYDFDGDGRDDLYFSGYNKLIGNAGTQRLCRSTGTGFTCTMIDNAHTVALAPGYGDAHTWPSFHDPARTDLDGDGRSDILRPGKPVYDAELTEWIFDNTAIYGMAYDETGGSGMGTLGNQLFAYGMPPEYRTAWTGGDAGDLNGDGYSDFVFSMGPTPSGTQFRRCLSTGMGTVNCETLNLAPSTSLGRVGDFDGDGVAEILLNNQSCVTRADGQVFCGVQWAMPPWPHPTLSPQFEGNREYWIDLTGDGVPDRVQYTVGGHWEVFSASPLAANGEALDRLIEVTDGLGQMAQFDYAAPGDATVYTPETTNPDGSSLSIAYPARQVARIDTLVSRLKISNGQGGWLETEYAYTGAARHQQGRGFLGFARIDATDTARGLVASTWYAQQWPQIGTTTATRRTHGAVRLSDAVQVPAVQTLTLSSGQSSNFTYLDNRSETRRDLDGSILPSSTTSWTYGDGWGNPTQIIEQVTGGGQTITTTTATTYQNDAATWLIGLPTRSTVTKTGFGSTVTRTTGRSYTAQGALRSETVEPDDLTYRLATTYDRDARWGLVSKVTQAWRDPATGTDLSRATETVVEFEGKGRYARRQQNALGHELSQTLGTTHGQPIAATDANNLTTTWTVDGFGRKTRETRPDGTETQYDDKQCDSGCPALATHVLIDQPLKSASRYAAPQLSYLDAGGRLLRSRSWGMDGRSTVSDRRYTARGLAYETDHPRYETDSAQLASRLGYDDLDRITSHAVPDETGTLRTTVTAYSGLQTTVTDPLNHAETTTRNALGLSAQITTAVGTTSFSYEPFGNLALVTDAAGNRVTIAYDRLGRRVALNDPDLGLITETRDPPGRLWRRQTPRQTPGGHYTTHSYDVLDRLTARVDANLESHWVFDSAVKGIGQLAEAYTGPAANKDYRRLHSYDSLGRPSLTQRVIDSTVYSSTATYDAWGRPASLTYQRGTDTPKAYTHTYGSLGDLIRIERGSQLLWQLQSEDANGRPTRQILGNGLTQNHGYDPESGRLTSAQLTQGVSTVRLDLGYSWDALGRLASRNRAWDGAGSQEGFTYDALGRLIQSQVQGQAALTQSYDAIGNLTAKGGVGGYTYPAAGQARPHAVQFDALGQLRLRRRRQPDQRPRRHAHLDGFRPARHAQPQRCLEQLRLRCRTAARASDPFRWEQALLRGGDGGRSGQWPGDDQDLLAQRSGSGDRAARPGQRAAVDSHRLARQCAGSDRQRGGVEGDVGLRRLG